MPKDALFGYSRCYCLNNTGVIAIKLSSKWSVPLAVSSTFIEWAEYSFYLYFSAVISLLFFPQDNETLALIMTFAVFGIAYASRPFGAILYGWLSDHWGRKPPMVIAIFSMGVATLAIGLLPTYESVGIAAPLLLLALRLIQSMSVAGEYNSAAVYLMEHAKVNKPLAGCAVGAASAGGMCLGGFVAVWVGFSELSYAWRIPFIGAGILSCVLCLLRRKLLETPVFIKEKAKQGTYNNPLVESLTNHRLSLFKIACIGAFVSIFVYICNGYFITFLYQQTTLSLNTSQLINAFNQLGVALLAPVLAYFSSPTRNTKLLCASMILIAIVAPLQFNVMLISMPVALGFILVGYVVANALMTASIFYYMYGLLPTMVRCTGTSFGWNVSAAIFGGTAPILAAIMVDTGFKVAPGIYVSVAALKCALCRP